jgi:hypothetical protein
MSSKTNLTWVVVLLLWNIALLGVIVFQLYRLDKHTVDIPTIVDACSAALKNK